MHPLEWTRESRKSRKRYSSNTGFLTCCCIAIECNVWYSSKQWVHSIQGGSEGEWENKCIEVRCLPRRERYLEKTNDRHRVKSMEREQRILYRWNSRHSLRSSDRRQQQNYSQPLNRRTRIVHRRSQPKFRLYRSTLFSLPEHRLIQWQAEWSQRTWRSICHPNSRLWPSYQMSPSSAIHRYQLDSSARSNTWFQHRAHDLISSTLSVNHRTDNRRWSVCRRIPQNRVYPASPHP